MDSASLNTHLVQRDLDEIRTVRAILEPLLGMLSRIAWDCRKQAEGYLIHGLLDFSDLYRYLHPFLDTSAYMEPARFYAEQVGLEYLFSKRPFQLFLLPDYLSEYDASLRSVQLQREQFMVEPVREAKLRVIRLDRKLVDALRSHAATLDEDDEQRRSDVQIDSRVIELFFDTVRRDLLRSGQQRFRKLRTNGVILMANQITGVEQRDLQPELGVEYDLVLEHLNMKRPPRGQNNRTDARAFYTACCLNKKYAKDQMLFLFITSSPRVIEAFDSEEIIRTVKLKGLFSEDDQPSLVRSADYFLLRLLLEASERKKGLSEFERFYELVLRYMQVSNTLGGYFGRAIRESDIRQESFRRNYEDACAIKQRLLPKIDVLSQFSLRRVGRHTLHRSVMERLDLKPVLDSLEMTERDMRESIEGVAREPKLIVEVFRKITKDLEDAIAQIEQGLVPLLYREDETDVVYDVHIDATKDKGVKRRAKAIVENLSRQSFDGFREAFRELSLMRTEYPDLPDTFVLSSKVYRSVRAYREALEYAKKALEISREYPEALLETALCYRRIAVVEEDSDLLAHSWDFCRRAGDCIDDPRVMRELAYLAWLALLGKWEMPSAVGEPLVLAEKYSRSALTASQKVLDADSLIVKNILNDLAYFLALRGDEVGLSEAEDLMKQALIDRDTLRLQTRASFEDTEGFILLQRHKLKPDHLLIQRASVLIRGAHSVAPENEVRQQHVAQCVDELMKSHLHLMEGNVT